MRRPRFFLNTILGVVIAAGCSNVPSAPVQEESPAQPNLIGSLISALLPGSCPNQESAETSAVIGPRGGTLQVGAHTIVIPPSALSKDIRITAKTGSQAGNAIQFGPEGLRFNTYATVTFDISNCRGWGLLRLPVVVYTDNLLLSILELEPSVVNSREKTVSGHITHFSRYAVAY